MIPAAPSALRRGPLFLSYAEQDERRAHDERREPRKHALPDDDAGRPAQPHFAPDRRHRRDAGRVEQREHEQRRHRKRRQRACDAALKEHLQRRHDALLGKEAADKRRADAPITEADGAHERCERAGEHRKDAVLRVRD